MALQYLVVGTGRDGTVSVTQLINSIFSLNGIQEEAAHEWLARECYEAYCHSRETGDTSGLDRLREQVRHCPFAAVVGNGYASVMQIFREELPDLAVVHLKRADRQAAISSHLKNSLLFSETYVYYGAKQGVMRRVAAFHEGEMSRQAWDGLSLQDRFGWYYDYTHRTIEAEKRNFARFLDLSTETISTQDSLESLARFIVPGHPVAPAKVHLNRHSYLTVEDFSESARPLAQWLFGRLAADRIEQDPVYLSDYVTNKFVTLAGYQVTGFIRQFAPDSAMSKDDLLDALCRYETLLYARLREVELLMEDLMATVEVRGPSDRKQAA